MSWRVPGAGPIGGGLGYGADWGTRPYIGANHFGCDTRWERAARHWGGRFGTEGGYEPAEMWYPRRTTDNSLAAAQGRNPEYFGRAWMNSRFPDQRSADPRFWY